MNRSGYEKQKFDPDRSVLRHTPFNEITANLTAFDFVERLLCEQNVSVFFGPPKSGKTLFVTDLALHIALGLPWYGRNVEQWCVLYFSLEGRAVVENRIAAWKKDRGIEEDENHPFWLLEGPINLLNGQIDADRICEIAQKMQEEFKLPVRMIILDTWSRANAGGKEDTADTSSAFANIDSIRDRTKAHIAILHHTPKGGDDPRGSGVMQANPDTLFSITKDKKTKIGTAKIQLQRDGEGDDEFHFYFEAVELGKNQRNKMITSCVIRPMGQAEIPKKGRTLQKQKKHMFDILVSLANSSKLCTKPKAGMEDKAIVSMKEFREACLIQLVFSTDKVDSKKRVIARNITDLINEGFIGESGDMVWLVDNSDILGQTNL